MGECERFKAVTTTPLLQKVDVVAYPHNIMGEKCMHTSYTNGANQYYETRKENPCTVSTHFLEKIEEPDYSCSDQSSRCNPGKTPLSRGNNTSYGVVIREDKNPRNCSSNAIASREAPLITAFSLLMLGSAIGTCDLHGNANGDGAITTYFD
ncbi:hypothetical protein JHK84_040765 [Glycine max]|nr:hypothetical protein JHK86_040553 [Glycine max]KAG5122425.1 hypothetical protein JHK84_040765 [Glycine max]